MRINVRNSVWLVIFIFFNINFRIWWVVIVNWCDWGSNEEIKINILFVLWVLSIWRLNICSVDVRGKSDDYVVLVVECNIKELILHTSVPKLLFLTSDWIVVEAWRNMHGENEMFSFGWNCIFICLHYTFHPINLLLCSFIWCPVFCILRLIQFSFIKVNGINAHYRDPLRKINVVISTILETRLNISKAISIWNIV